MQSNNAEILIIVHPATQERKELTWPEYVEECRKAKAWQRALENAIAIPAALADKAQRRT